MDADIYGTDNVMSVVRYLFEESRALSEAIEQYVRDYGLQFKPEQWPQDIRFESEGQPQVVRCFRTACGYFLATDKPCMWYRLLHVEGKHSALYESACQHLLSRVRYRVGVIHELINCLQSLNDTMRGWLEQAKAEVERSTQNQLQSQEFQELLLIAKLSE